MLIGSGRCRAGTLILFLLLLLPSGPLGQPGPPTPSAPSDTLTPGKTAQPTPPSNPLASPTPAAQDSLTQPKSRADTVLVVKHAFNHRQQIITGSVVMTCLALMMVVMNNYNPR